MYKLLIFDWDGTIIDSAARIISSMQAAARDCQLSEPSDDAVRNIIGLGLPEAIQQIFPEIDAHGIEQMRQQYSESFIAADNIPSPLFDGVREGLGRMRDRGIAMAVATGKSRKGLDRALGQTDLASVFIGSRCADETTSKPDPHMLAELLQETGLEPHEAVIIGDTEYDLEMGQRIGMDVIAVTYGAHHAERLKKYNPVFIADNFSALEQWLDANSVCS